MIGPRLGICITKVSSSKEGEPHEYYEVCGLKNTFIPGIDLNEKTIDVLILEVEVAKELCDVLAWKLSRSGTEGF